MKIELQKRLLIWKEIIYYLVVKINNINKYNGIIYVFIDTLTINSDKFPLNFEIEQGKILLI